MPAPLRSQFNVACFTEVPLTQLHLLVGDIPGRQIKLEPYGLVFRKEFIVASGGQPAIYINSYNNNQWLRESVDELFEKAIVNGNLVSNLWRLLPFINAMHERYDFTWEREWRTREALTFKGSDIVCAILPPTGDEDLRNLLARYAVAVISPGWTYEQIVSELAQQQRHTRELIEVEREPATVEAPHVHGNAEG